MMFSMDFLKKMAISKRIEKETNNKNYERLF